MRQPKHGQLQSKKNHESYLIWNSRNVELGECGPWGWSHDYIDDGVRKEEMEIAIKLWDLMDTLTNREKQCITMRMHGFSLEEVGKIFEVTKERVRQIESKAMRKMRHPSRAGTLPDPYPGWHGYRTTKPFKHPGFAWEKWAS